MHRTPVRPRRILLVSWLPLAALALILTTVPDASQYGNGPRSTEGIGPNATQGVTSSAAEGVDTAGAAALRVQLDPESGALIQDTSPVAFKAPELEIMLSRSDDGLVEEHLPNGTVRVHLQGRFQNATVAHIGQDGTVHTRCSDQLHELEGHLSGCTHSTPQSNLEVK